MDTTSQTKLSKDEWKSIEVPVQPEELRIIQFIQQGFHHPEKVESTMKSLYTYLKLSPSPALDLYLYQYYFKLTKVKKEIKMKKADEIRIEASIKQVPDTIYEKVLVDLCAKKEFFHLEWMTKLNVSKVNPYVMEYVKECMSKHKADIVAWTRQADDLLERNPYVQYKDMELYKHQKELFTIAKEEGPKCIVYVAPTGTGKTMSPVGLSEKYKIIFVCAARHVGLALAKACLSANKKIAFAFGCETEQDVKLHYSSVRECTRDKRTGMIRKVDNMIGDKVEVMISDVKSYLSAMQYMLRFNEPNTLLYYWDEPTIAMDVEEHPLHEVIRRNWIENKIPNIVLSSATMPKLDYSMFTTSTVHFIHSYESSKTIQLVNPANQIVLPHHCDYEDLLRVIEHLESNLLLLKYVDLGSVLQFLQSKPIPFTKVDEITVTNIKKYYLSLLKTMTLEEWKLEQTKRISVPSTIQLCSSDAWTCSHGPTIYVAEDVQKIATYCLKTAAIPTSLLDDLMKQMAYNNAIADKMVQLEKDMEDKNKDDDKEKKMMDNRVNPEVKRIQTELSRLQSTIHAIALPNAYVPNRYDHLKRYGQLDKLSIAFTSDLDMSIIEKVLSTDIDTSWKLLLMMGIGVFSVDSPPRYLELIKEQTARQKMYLILATTDYIYGTNYQFANLYIGKDMNVSQEKLIQTMGRVGRGKQVPYSIRFRDDKFIKTLFLPQTSPEANVMTRLFTV